MFELPAAKVGTIPHLSLVKACLFALTAAQKHCPRWDFAQQPSSDNLTYCDGGAEEKGLAEDANRVILWCNIFSSPFRWRLCTEEELMKTESSVKVEVKVDSSLPFPGDNKHSNTTKEVMNTWHKAPWCLYCCLTPLRKWKVSLSPFGCIFECSCAVSEWHALASIATWAIVFQFTPFIWEEVYFHFFTAIVKLAYDCVRLLLTRPSSNYRSFWW